MMLIGGERIVETKVRPNGQPPTTTLGSRRVRLPASFRPPFVVVVFHDYTDALRPYPLLAPNPLLRPTRPQALALKPLQFAVRDCPRGVSTPATVFLFRVNATTAAPFTAGEHRPADHSGKFLDRIPVAHLLA